MHVHCSAGLTCTHGWNNLLFTFKLNHIAAFVTLIHRRLKRALEHIFDLDLRGKLTTNTELPQNGIRQIHHPCFPYLNLGIGRAFFFKRDTSYLLKYALLSCCCCFLNIKLVGTPCSYMHVPICVSRTFPPHSQVPPRSMHA